MEAFHSLKIYYKSKQKLVLSGRFSNFFGESGIQIFKYILFFRFFWKKSEDGSWFVEM